MRRFNICLVVVLSLSCSGVKTPLACCVRPSKHQRCVQHGKSLRSAMRGGAPVMLNAQFAANVFNMATMAKLKLNFQPITANAG